MDGFRYEDYLALCEPWRFTDTWACIPADPSAFRGPLNPAAALAALTEKFSEQQLLDAGLVRRDVDGTLSMHALLAEPDVAIVALREPATGYVSNLMTTRGCVTGGRWPLFAARSDAHTLKALELSSGALLLTGDVEDTILFRSLGLPAVPIAGVADFSHQDLLLLDESFGVAHGPDDDPEPYEEQSIGPTDPANSPVGSPTAVAGPSYLPFGNASDSELDEEIRLTVVRWSPRSLSPAECDTVTQAVRYLHELEKFRRLDLGVVNEWLATADLLERIEFALARQEPSWVIDAVLDSLLLARSFQSGQRSAEKNAPDDLVTVIEQLQDAHLEQHDPGGRNRQKASLAYRRMVTRQITGPMRRQALAAADPSEQARQMIFAELFDVFVQKVQSVNVALSRPAAAGSAMARSHQDAVSELLTISNKLIPLAKELSSSTLPYKLHPKRPLVIDSQPCGNLALPTKK